MHALVTGAGGFLGLYIVEQLVARGDRVRAFVRRPSPALEALGVEIVVGDIRDAEAVSRACQKTDVVFHTAAIAGIWGPWQRYYQTNTVGTSYVIDACRRQNVGRLVFTSSPSVTFDGSDQCGVDETADYPTHWLAHYPHSKAMAEQEVLAAHDERGLLTCSLRPHLIWGPRDGHLVPRLIARARAGRLRRVGNGENLIDMIYVDNAAAAHLAAADALMPGSPVGGRAYFLSQGEPVNCWQWIDELLALAKLPPVRRSIPLRAGYALGGALEIAYSLARIDREPPMTRFLATQLGRHHWFNIDRARADFGYAPKISTAEGMQRLKQAMGSAS
ncbi:MAG TPA: NAD-dependent epimerase/dehydratase family protein [Pirellulales bacterium]|jgi:nucleoside-diphosphate-sugar epimerase|nr:NAD-dependent epimerase/dehydratase family protein [Pirellulales bacterium]